MKMSQAKQGFLTFMISDGYSKSTINLYDHILSMMGAYLDDPDIRKIKHKDLINYFAYLRTDYKPKRKSGDTKPYSGGSMRNHWKGMRSFFKWCLEDGHIKERPDLRIKLPPNNPKVILPLSKDEIKKLISAAQYMEVKPGNRSVYVAKRRTMYRDLAMLLFLIDTGLRIGELCRVKIGDVNFETGEVYIAPFGNSNRKTKSRVVFLGKNAKRTLWRYLATEDRDNQGDLLFISSLDGGPMTPNAARCLMVDLGEKVGVKNVHPHRFRHTFCIEFLRNGGDVFSLKQISGINSWKILQNYVALSKVDAARVHKNASPADNWKL